MIADHLTGIENSDADLRKIADELRAHTGLASNDYFMPLIGFLFLGHATSRSHEVEAAIRTGQATVKMPKRLLANADFVKRWQYGVPPDKAIARIADTNSSREIEL